MALFKKEVHAYCGKKFGMLDRLKLAESWMAQKQTKVLYPVKKIKYVGTNKGLLVERRRVIPSTDKSSGFLTRNFQ